MPADYQKGHFQRRIPAAASIGGITGLLWMMQLLKRTDEGSAQPLSLPRSWPWIIGGLVFILAYAAIFGPTLRL
ncbi:MAG: hypothetical protein PHQ40_18975 [Anaerolineaceae bacterium]|nr:hypothetical protein [Anaerolineaceae bacterium]